MGGSESSVMEMGACVGRGRGCSSSSTTQGAGDGGGGGGGGDDDDDDDDVDDDDDGVVVVDKVVDVTSVSKESHSSLLVAISGTIFMRSTSTCEINTNTRLHEESTV